jgi:hypothetical protein
MTSKLPSGLPGDSRMDIAKELCPHSVFERANAIVAHSVDQAITTMLIPQTTLFFGVPTPGLVLLAVRSDLAVPVTVLRMAQV